MDLAVRSMDSTMRLRSLSAVVGRLRTLANATMALAAWRSSWRSRASSSVLKAYFGGVSSSVDSARDSGSGRQRAWHNPSG
jgi:hypothetical protein